MEDDFFKFEEPQEPQEIQPNDEVQVEETFEEFTEPQEETHEQSYLDLLLQAKGLNKDEIQIYDENNNLTKVPFDSLSEQEKFDVLSGADTPAIDDSELQVLNYLRQNNMSLQDFADWQKQVGVQEYLAQQQPVSEIDSLTDEEVVAYDFIKRFGDSLSDEEVDNEVERLKSDPEAFSKRVQLLRTAYKNEEEAQKKLYEDQETTKRQEDEKAFISAYNTALQNIDSIQGIELDSSDKNELMQFVLAKDQSGRTELSKALDDPESVLKMAWFLRHGEDAMNSVIDYFKSEITKRERGNGARVVNRQTKQSVPDAFKF